MNLKFLTKFAAWLLLALVFNQIEASAQRCLPEGIVFVRQTQIDSFSLLYPGCHEIEGSVTIGTYGSGNGAITSLQGLGQLTRISGELKIWYKVTVSNAGLCYATDSVLMLKCDLPLIMPNAFTPNDDGTNDLFRPAVRFEGITGFHMLIFDQWGGRIFETGDIRTGWDGTVNGGTGSLRGICLYHHIRVRPG